MTTYFHGNPSEIGGGADGLQTLILKNPAYVGYTDTNTHPPQTSNFVFLNSNNHSLPHAPPSQTQHFVGIPFHGTSAAAAATSQHDVSGLHHGFLHPRAHLYNLPPDLGAVREVTRAQQGLSLSLSSQQPPPGYDSFCRPERPQVVVPSQDDVRPSSGVNGVQSVLLSSKYLKAAQELLDEVVNVGRGANQPKNIGDTSAGAASGDGQSGGESSAKRGSAELTTSERQEIQMKKAKLVNMLDEVEQRYRQYHRQMQIVVSLFENAAGVGSAKTYTALALQTISKQFRCLKDAILTQIRDASRSRGEDEMNPEGQFEGSRLRYVDNKIRQQRALQQLGMIQHNAWRPQRGLPERSVSVLRAWLFEHFLHPYPKDSDKHMLAKQTGLTRSQVSNWFINARVRLWKPMVEEMYTEEMKEHDKNGTENTNNNNRTGQTEQNEDSASKSTAFPQAKSPNTEHHNNPSMIIPMSSSSASPSPSTMRHGIAGFNVSSGIESITHNNNSPKKLRISDMLHDDDKQGGKEGFTLMGGPANFIGGFGSYPMGELGRFGDEQFPYSGSNNNGVSLTLGLPHCDNIGGHQSFLRNQGMQHLGRGVEIEETGSFGSMGAHQTNPHPSNVYENISIHDRKRYAAQLLPDFVA